MKPPHNVAFLERAIRRLASTNEESVRLRVMMAHEEVDLKEVCGICRRLFANRKLQPWPSRVEPTKGWALAYAETKAQLPVLATIDEAVSWVNDLIARIEKVGR